MSKIYSGSANHVPVGTTKTLHTGSGKVYGVVITNSGTSGSLTLYDNTSGSGTVLAIYYSNYYPMGIFYPLETPLQFITGLTAVTTTTVTAHLITGA
jgi:hypothetical protein